ncbi:MAG TPA: PEPxxWA-CTERM sorting domain-containing protein [Sphingobium sp.]|nr:PEPxxWA-CTERM sorting domain-containing protein [Sphingobium sp.]
MRKLLKHIAIASVLVAGSATSASAAIVLNGSFEDGLNHWTVLDGVGTTPGQGITTVITNGVADSTGYGDIVPSYDGGHAAYFVDDRAIQNLSQFVTLQGGTEYTLSFALFATESGANNPNFFAFTNTFGLLLGDTRINSSSQTDVPVGVWTPYTYTFTAPVTSSLYLLNFNFIAGQTPAKDLLLDGVSITAAAVPEPATWAMMIGGLALVGFSMRRRKVAVSFA